MQFYSRNQKDMNEVTNKVHIQGMMVYYTECINRNHNINSYTVHTTMYMYSSDSVYVPLHATYNVYGMRHNYTL